MNEIGQFYKVTGTAQGKSPATRAAHIAPGGLSMAHDWNELTRLTHGSPVVVERVRMQETGIAIEGSFELPPLARLSAEDQVFVMAFVQCDGSIKDMEHTFGISYPTVKNSLAPNCGQLLFVELKRTSFMTTY
jgi:hypothetical protein